MILCGTGHRPDKLGGYSEEAGELLASFATSQLIKLKPSLVISGMALGWDTALAKAAVELDIPFHAYIPFAGQDIRWPNISKYQYHELLAKAQHVKYCSEEGYAVWKMQKRNECMVNDSNLVLALWNGSAGGTGNCVGYASKTGTEILNVWDEYEEFRINPAG